MFAVALALTFAVWYRSERTLSIHSVVTGRREAFYWLAILFTFALGTAAGDLVDEQFGVGYWPTALLVALIIGAIAVSHLVFRANAVLTFWLAYILTRPLGASLGRRAVAAEGRRRPRARARRGPACCSSSTILAVVVYLAVTKRDQTPPVPVGATDD